MVERDMDVLDLSTLNFKDVPFSRFGEDERFDFDLEEFCGDPDDAPETIKFHEGTLKVSSNLLLDRPDSQFGVYFVDGDLEVEGNLMLSAWDSYTAVMVSGNIVAKGLFIDADMFVQVLGNVQVSDCIHASLSDAGQFTVKGSLSAAAAYIGGEYVSIGSTEAEQVEDAEGLDASRFPQCAAIAERMSMGALAESVKKIP